MTINDRIQSSRTERDAILSDARAQLIRLHHRQRKLLPDADDPWVLSEIVSIESQIRAAAAELGQPALARFESRLGWITECERPR